MKKLIVVSTVVLSLLTEFTINIVSAEDNKMEQTDVNKEVENKFRSILENPESIFDFKVTEAKYIIKSTDADYILISATSEELKGIYNVKAFVFDKEKNKVVELENEFAIGETEGKFSGKLVEYSNNANKLRYTVKSIPNDKFEIKDISFANNEIKDEIVRSGLISKDKLPTANVVELTWKNLELKKDENDSNQSVSTQSTLKGNDTSEKVGQKQQDSITSGQRTTIAPTVERKENKKSKLDINSIASGDLSSIYGSYAINNSTIVLDNGVVLGVNSVKKEGNTAVIESQIQISEEERKAVEEAKKNGEITVFAPDGKNTVKHTFIPAGEKTPGFSDFPNDDINRDRVLIQGHGIEIQYID